MKDIESVRSLKQLLKQLLSHSNRGVCPMT